MTSAKRWLCILAWRQSHYDVHADSIMIGQATRSARVANQSSFKALFTVALSMGLREGEALGLKWENVDLEAGKLAVHYTLQRVKPSPQEKGRLMLIEPKTDKSRRVIMLPKPKFLRLS